MKDIPRHSLEVGWHVAAAAICSAATRRAKLPLLAVLAVDMLMICGLIYHVNANWVELTEPQWLPAK